MITRLRGDAGSKIGNRDVSEMRTAMYDIRVLDLVLVVRASPKGLGVV